MRGSLSLLVAVLMLMLALSPVGCKRKNPLPPPARGPNVLLIAVDTLRADKLGCYGSDLGATPKIDALAAEGVRFQQAYAHAPWTLPSFASMFTSQMPSRHGAGGRVGQLTKLPDDARTVALCFKEAGYATAAVVNVNYLTESFGLTTGFDHVDFEVHPNNVEMRSAGKTTDAALKWLESRPERSFFLLVHYFDPHLVYAPPVEYRARFADPRDRQPGGAVFGTREQIVAYRKGQVTFSAEQIQRAEKLYDGEVAYTDHEIGRLLDGLEKMKLAESTLVVFTADHGEEFLDHGGFEHGHTLYNELVHVPLIMRHPKWIKPGVVPSAVGLVDLAPTMCSVTGVPADPAFTGRNLLDLIGAEHPRGRPVALEGNLWGAPFRGWVHEGFKLIVSSNGAELFNLEADRQEQTNLSLVETERLQAMQADLNLAFEAISASVTDAPEPAQLDDEELERLRSLGYAP